MRKMWIPYSGNAETAPFVEAWKAAERLDVYFLDFAFGQATAPARRPFLFKERVRSEFSSVGSPPSMPEGEYRLAWPLPRATGAVRPKLGFDLSCIIWERGRAQDDL